MWRSNDQIAQATGVLPAEVRNLDVRTQQALSDDGEAAQPWSITDEAGSAVDTLSDGTLYELRVSVADGGAFDLSKTEKEIKISVVLAK